MAFKMKGFSAFTKKTKTKLADGSVAIVKTFKNPITGATRKISKNKGGKHNVNMKTVVVKDKDGTKKVKMKGKMGEGQKVNKAKGKTFSEASMKMQQKN